MRHHTALTRIAALDHRPGFFMVREYSRMEDCGQEGKLMSRRMTALWRVIVLYGIVGSLVLTLLACGGPGCTNCLENMTFLCRGGHCIDAPDHATNSVGAQ